MTATGDGQQRSGRPPSNFQFLAAGWPKLAIEAATAEKNVVADPRAACFYARRTLELTVKWMYDADRELRQPYKSDLRGMLFEPTFRNAVDPKVRAKMDVIRKRGNQAVHRDNVMNAEQSVQAVRELFHVLYWVAATYARDEGQRPAAGIEFDTNVIPRPATVEQRLARREELERRAAEQASKDAEAERQREQNESLQAEIERLRSEVVAAKAANAARADDHDYDEQRTRDEYIDLLLSEAGWPLQDERDREYEVSGMPNNKGVGYVDYVLWGDDGKPLGLVEAKRTSRDARVGRQQAKLYADCLEAQFGQRPVIFYSNGYEHWMWDDSTYPPRQVQGFYTKDELALLVDRRASRKPLAEVEIDSGIVERHYQHRAIRRIGETLDGDRQRAALVVMATGAGKTRMMIALVDQMMRAGWVKRVLFLADRVALVNQATGAFKEHLPKAATVNLVTEKNADGRVYVSTYPTMMGRIGEAEGGAARRFGPGFFDLIVIDEAHRSVYQKYRAIFDYFDSLLVGLTATPKDEVDRNTYGLFDLESGVPTDSYDLSEAVSEGYLVPPRAVSVPLKFPSQGVRYDDLPEDEKEQWEEKDWGEEDMPDEVDAEAVNRWLFNEDTVDKLLATLMERGQRVAGNDRLGKTIVFAKNSAHAEFIAERFDANYPEYGGHFARTITFKTEYAQSLLDDFSVADRAPHIAVSVDMLDTGIDVPEVVNLVFFKRVRSKTKFWQMIGRGTRLCPDLFGPGQHKRDFYVFDCCENVVYFNQDLPAAEGSLSPSLTERLFGERLELMLALDGHPNPGESGRALRDDAAGVLHGQVAGMNLDNFLVRPHRRLVEHYSERRAWDSLTPEDAEKAGARLADLPTTERDEDEAAKRFDLMLLGLQLRQLQPLPGEERLRRQVQEIAAGLLEQTSIPAISKEEELLEELASEGWWEDVTLAMLERARKRVRSLVRLLEKRKRAIVYTDFIDELGDVEELEFVGVGTGGVDLERFRAKTRVYLREHEDLVALQKLRRNRPLTATDLGELERVLLEAGVATAELLEGLRAHRTGLGAFVRTLVGLERSAASEALGTFIDGRNLSADQLHFIDHVVDHLTQNGIMDPRRLYDAPFTDLAPHGPEDLFADPDVDALVAVLHTVATNADRPAAA